MTRQIGSKTLAEHLESFKSNKGYLLPPMQRYVIRKVADEEAESERRSDIMHPSEMCKPDWCPRRDFYRMTLGDRRDIEPRFNSELIFAEGHTIHNKYQAWLQGMGLLYGRWVCKDCGESFFAQSPEACINGHTRLRYREVPLESIEYMIAGHADGAVNEGNDWLTVDEPFLIEVKSIGVGTVRVEHPSLHRRYTDDELTLEQLWQEIKRPFPSHIQQATLYCWLSGTYKKMVFIYESKWNQKTKEFVVTPNFDHIEWLLNAAKDVAQSIRSGTEPYKPGWARQDHKTCKKCPYQAECWGVTHDEADQPKPVLVRKAPAARRRKALRPT